MLVSLKLPFALRQSADSLSPETEIRLQLLWKLLRLFKLVNISFPLLFSIPRIRMEVLSKVRFALRQRADSVSPVIEMFLQLCWKVLGSIAKAEGILT